MYFLLFLSLWNSEAFFFYWTSFSDDLWVNNNETLPVNMENKYSLTGKQVREPWSRYNTICIP